VPSKTEIKICLGSSCFSRGNKKTLQLIQNFIQDYSLEERVVLKGNHCFSDCSKGPILEVDGILYEKVDSDNVLDILRQVLDINS